MSESDKIKKEPHLKQIKNYMHVNTCMQQQRQDIIYLKSKKKRKLSVRVHELMVGRACDYKRDSI